MNEKGYYLAGPMSGIPRFNFPAFAKASELLRERGFKIVSPAELDDAEDKEWAKLSLDGNPVDHPRKTWGDFLARDVKIVSDQVGGIIFLPQWEKSRGAKLEAFVGLLSGPDFEFHQWHDDGMLHQLDRRHVAAVIFSEVMRNV